MPIYQSKSPEEKNWETISEKAAIEDLSDNFERLSPILIEMLNGKEINTQSCMYRIINHGEIRRVYQFSNIKLKD